MNENATVVLGPNRVLVSAKEAQEVLCIKSRKLWSLTNAGTVPCVRIGRAVRYDIRDLMKYIESLKKNRRHA